MAACVSCVCWVNRGIAKRIPEKVSLEEDEVQALLSSKTSHDDSKLKKDGVCDKDSLSDDDIEALYGLDKYSDSEDEDSNVLPMMAGLATYASFKDDPYLSNDSDVENSDNDDFIIEPDDNLLLVGRANSDNSSIEVYVFNEKNNDCYCHHEVLISGHPLAVEWLDYDPEQPDVQGNFFAVGTILPVIEIWDIDLVNAPDPVYTLGKVPKKPKKMPHHSHSDAVIALSWNKFIRSVLASASADHTVRVWDLSDCKCLLILEHPDKVQTLQWHSTNPSLLATGCYDGIVRLYNCESGNLLKHWKFTGEIEKLLWNHFNIDYLLVSTDQMKVICINTSKDKIKFSIDAHSEAVTDMSMSISTKGLLLTCSIDDTISFWKVKKTNPKLLWSQQLNLGGALCAKFCSDSPNMVAIGGETSEFKVMNLLSIPSVSNYLKKDKRKKEKLEEVSFTHEDDLTKNSTEHNDTGVRTSTSQSTSLSSESSPPKKKKKRSK